MVLRRLSQKLIAFITVASLGIAMPVNAAENEEPIEAEVPADTDSTDEGVSQEGAQLLNDAFGEVVFYRWDRVYRNDYPTDDEWHLTMLVWTRDDMTIDDGYIGALAPDDIWQGPEADPVPGVTHRFTNNDAVYKKDFKDKEWILEKETYYLRLTDRAEGIDVNSDPQVQTDKNTFYTDDDRDCLYVKYGGRDKKNEGEDDYDAPVYHMKMSKSENAPADYDYIMEPWGEGSNSAIKFHATEYKAEWSFASQSSKVGDVFRVFYQKKHEHDPTLTVGEGKRFAHVRSDDKDWNLYKWFIGKKLRFSSINGNLTVGAGQLLSISPSNYVDTAGSEESQNGVINPAGNTVTIEKGGILSISGEFINNGTIINNGGTIVIQKGGAIYPFLQGADTSLGCGALKCNGGDIIIEEGGALYTGMNIALASDNVKRTAPFWLDNSSTLINYGLLCCGTLGLGDASVIENRGNGRIYSCLWQPDWGTFVQQLSDNNSRLMSGNTESLLDLAYINQGNDVYGGITIIDWPTTLKNTPAVFVAGDESSINNPNQDWKNTFISQGLIDFKKLEL